VLYLIQPSSEQMICFDYSTYSILCTLRKTMFKIKTIVSKFHHFLKDLKMMWSEMGVKFNLTQLLSRRESKNKNKKFANSLSNGLFFYREHQNWQRCKIHNNKP
jgi:hypothetical protein